MTEQVATLFGEPVYLDKDAPDDTFVIHSGINAGVNMEFRASIRLCVGKLVSYPGTYQELCDLIANDESIKGAFGQ